MVDTEPNPLPLALVAQKYGDKIANDLNRHERSQLLNTATMWAAMRQHRGETGKRGYAL